MPRDSCTPKLVDEPRPAPQRPAEKSHAFGTESRARARCSSNRRSSTRRIFPLRVFGNSSTNSISRGVLVRRGHALAVLLQLADERVGGVHPRPQHDERLHDQPAILVRLADDRALGHAGVLEQRALDLERPDPVGGGIDDVVGAPGEPEIAVLVPCRPVAGHVPVAAEHGRRLLRCAVVLAEQARRPRSRSRPERDVAFLADAGDLAVVVDHGDLVPGRRQAHRTGADLGAREVADEERVLRLPVAVVDREPERVAERLDHLRVQRLARGDHVAQPGEAEAVESVELRHQPVLGRGLAEHGDAELGDQVEPLLGLERALVEHDRGAGVPWPEQHVPDRLRPAGRRRAPDEVAGPGRQPALCLHPLREAVAVRVNDTLRVLGRPGRVQDERGVGRGRVCSRRRLRLVVQVGRVREQHLRVESFDLSLGLPVGDDEPRARVLQPEGEILVAEHLRARNRDGAELEQREHARMPFGRLADEDEHAVSPLHACARQPVRPLRGAGGDLGELEVAPFA